MKKAILTHLMSVLPLYRNQSSHLHTKSIDWLLCESNTGIIFRDLGSDIVKLRVHVSISFQFQFQFQFHFSSY